MQSRSVIISLQLKYCPRKLKSYEAQDCSKGPSVQRACVHVCRKKRINMKESYKYCEAEKKSPTSMKLISFIFFPILSQLLHLPPTKMQYQYSLMFPSRKKYSCTFKFLKPKSNQYTMAGMQFLKKIVFVLLKGRTMSISEKKNPALEATTFIFSQEEN